MLTFIGVFFIAVVLGFAVIMLIIAAVERIIKALKGGA
jgi:hypothetical protein